MKIMSQKFSKFFAICIALLMVVAVLVPTTSVMASDDTNNVMEESVESEIQSDASEKETEQQEEQEKGNDNDTQEDPDEKSGDNSVVIKDSADSGMAEQNKTPQENAIVQEAEQEMSLFSDVGILNANAILDAAELQQEIDNGSVDLVLADDTADFVIDIPITVPAGKQVSIDINGRTVKQQKGISIAGGLTLKNSKSTGMIIRDTGYTASMLAVTGSLRTSDIVIDGGAVWTGSENTYLKRGTTNSGIAASASIVAVSNAAATFNMNANTTCLLYTSQERNLAIRRTRSSYPSAVAQGHPCLA